MKPEEYLDAIRATPSEVERFLTRRDDRGLQPNRGWTYHAELGWIHADAVHIGDGVGGTNTYYHYEEDGARRSVHAAHVPCRLSTFGNSFTHCDQVNDGETWQEYLAAHLCEPIRNYGVGGYSVYQAYRRMKKVHREGRLDGAYIVLNLFEDDHFRNLDSCRRLRHGRRSNCGFTLPHLRVNAEDQSLHEIENLIARGEDVYRLCDPDYLRQMFDNDPIAQMALRLRNLTSVQASTLDPVPISIGIPGSATDCEEARQLGRAYVHSALSASKYVVERVEAFCHAEGKRLLVVLSFGEPAMTKALGGEEIFDRPFAEWIQTRGYPVVDMRDAFAAELANSRQDIGTFLKRYYNGHHSPAGNFFTAWALKDTIAKWLDPSPRPYQAAQGHCREANGMADPLNSRTGSK